MKSSSQLSVSQKSSKSGSSVGRLSYREHRGPPARERTPVADRGASPLLRPPSFNTLEKAELGGSAIPGTMIAPPSADDPNRPGEPIPIGYRFFPMSVNGLLRYDDHRKTR